MLSTRPPKAGHQTQIFDGSDETYPDWKGRVKSYLRSDTRAFIGELLSWAEKQVEPIASENYPTLELEYPALREYSAAQVDAAIYDALNLTIKAAVNRAKGKVAGEGKGLEYWRILFVDRESDGAEVRWNKRERFAYPKEASALEELDSMLQQWEALG